MINTNNQTVIKAENEALINKDQNRNDCKPPRRSSDSKRFTFSRKSKLAFEIDFHGLNFNNILKRAPFRN